MNAPTKAIRNDTFKHITLAGIALFFAQGYFGFGVDYYALYYKPNNFGSSFDALGLLALTISIMGFKLGFFICFYLHLLAKSRFIEEFFKVNSQLLILLIAFSWPTIFSLLNVMRQGVMEALVLIGLLQFNKSYFRAGCLFLLAALFHRAGFILLYIFAIYLVLIGLENKKPLRFFIFLSAQFSIFLAIYIINGPEKTHSTGLNLSYFYIGVTAFLLGSHLLSKSRIQKNRHKPLMDFTLLYSISSINFYLIGMTWQYERLMMIMFFPLIFCILTVLNLKSRQAFPLIVISLFLLTFTTGKLNAFH